MQQSGVLHTPSRAGDVTNSTFKDKPLAGALTHILWQPPLRVPLEEPAGHLLCQESWQGGWVSRRRRWKNTMIPRKRRPPFSCPKEVTKSPPKFRTTGLKSRQGSSGKSLQQQGHVMCCLLSCQGLVLLSLSPQKVNDWLCLSPKGTLLWLIGTPGDRVD